MSDFIDMFCGMLPALSEIQKDTNSLRKVLDYSVGTYMDEQDDIFDELFLESASNGWLDAFGKDFGVLRRIDEDDQSYRKRIIFEKMEYLTAKNLKDIYDVTLYVFLQDFSAEDNELTSDNPYLASKYMTEISEDLQNILNKKFVVGDEIEWL